jgi:hypothetical protein
VFDAMQRIWRATDLGRVKSVATIPAISTHQQQGEEGRTLAGIPMNLIRLCVGGEHPDDIIADLSQALDAAEAKVTVSMSSATPAGQCCSAGGGGRCCPEDTPSRRGTAGSAGEASGGNRP